MSVKLNLRNVREDDCRYIWEWRNDPVSRKVSSNTQEIPYEKHKKWFEASLKNPKRRIYVATDGGKRIGQIRFDKENAIAIVSVTVAPEMRGRGYGAELIKKGSARYFTEENIKIICAEIKKDNVVSIKAFEKAGYRKIKENDKIEMHLERKWIAH